MDPDTHQLQDQPDPLPVKPRSEQTAQRDRARRSLAAELAPECPTGERITEFLPLPDAPAPSVPRDAGMPPVTPSEPPPLWENYSRCELWELYEAARATALTRVTEVDRLKRFGAAQQATAQTTLTHAGDEYNRLLLIETEKSTMALAGQAESAKTELARQLEAYAKQLQTHFDAQRVQMRAELAQQVTLCAAHEAETRRVVQIYGILQQKHIVLLRIRTIAIVVLILVFFYWKFIN